MISSDLSASARHHALQRKLAGIRGKLTVVERQIAEAQSGDQSPQEPSLFGQQPSSHPGLRALQDRKRQLEHVVKLLEEELRGRTVGR